MHDLSTLKERLADLRQRRGPLLSLYLPLLPDDFGRSSRTARTRASSTMQSLDVPVPIRDRVLRDLEEGPIHGRVSAIFADASSLEIIPLDIDLPVVDPTTGQAEARYGAPLLYPLELALERFGDAAAIYVDGERVRVFELSLGHAVEIASETRAPSPDELDRLQESKTIHPAHVADRGSSASDDASDHIADLRDRFYDQVLAEIGERLHHRRLFLLGPKEGVGNFERRLAPEMRARVCARLNGLSSPEATSDEVFARVQPLLESEIVAAQTQLLDDIAERGFRGVQRCLEELQIGRVARLAVPLRVDGEVFVEPVTGYAASSRELALARADGAAEIEVRPLREELPRLARSHGTGIELITGDNAIRLLEELEGMGGLPRW